VAKRLASDGFAVAVHYAGNSAKAQEVVSEIKASGGKAIAVQADVAKAAGVARQWRFCLKHEDHQRIRFIQQRN
jgi:3-oxoacyl-[acyl-carrier protein] reductase